MRRPSFLLAVMMAAFAAHGAGTYPLAPGPSDHAIQKFDLPAAPLRVTVRRRKTAEGKLKRKHRVVKGKFRKQMRYGTTGRQYRWRVFRVSDDDWYVAHCPVEARRAFIENEGEGYDAEDIATWFYNPAEEVTPAEMQRLRYMTDEDQSVSITFAEELARRIANGLNKPELFATSNY